jgi:hypothetical protein
MIENKGPLFLITDTRLGQYLEAQDVCKRLPAGPGPNTAYDMWAKASWRYGFEEHGEARIYLRDTHPGHMPKPKSGE